MNTLTASIQESLEAKHEAEWKRLGVPDDSSKVDAVPSSRGKGVLQMSTTRMLQTFTLWLGAVLAFPAMAATFEFTQNGFIGGATLSGLFTGIDANHDGRLIVNFDGTNELSNFSVTFSGNAEVAGFTLGMNELLTSQLGVPCCNEATGEFFYFNLDSTNDLQFVAMSADKIIILADGDPQLVNGGLVGTNCAFVQGRGSCDQRSGVTPYSTIALHAVPLPSALWLLLSALGAFFKFFWSATKPYAMRAG